MDIRMATYKEDLEDILRGIDQNIQTVDDPEVEIKRHGLQRSENVNPDDYPPGTWFYYPPRERDDFGCYVR